MSIERTTVRAIVRSLDGNLAQVEVEHGGCGRCHETGGCGGQQLTQMFCGSPKTYQVENAIGATVGDRVTIGIVAGSVSRSANLAYILPLAATIAGAATGSSFGGDFGAMIGAGIGLSFAFLVVILRSYGPSGKIAERPQIISHS